jgi:glucokinase
MKNFIGVDVGGTKISAAIVAEDGKILADVKQPSPRECSTKETVQSIVDAVQSVMKESLSEIQGIGVGIPGIVDCNRNLIHKTPNINLSGVRVAKELQKVFSMPVAAGNDVNLGLLGEQWLGSAKGKRNVLGLFPGTGIGGAILCEGQLYLGHQGAAGEIGHMIINTEGPKCACGNRGCLEAYAGRWAIERDIKDAIKQGRKSLITELADDLSLIKSKALKTALKEKDPLITEIMEKIATILGQACISLNHIFNSEMIVLGGGVMEACGEFLLPRVEKIVRADPFFSDLKPCKITPAVLGDDAVLLGAAALVRQSVANSTYPEIAESDGKIKINQETWNEDVFIRADGKVKPFKIKQHENKKTAVLSIKDIERITKKFPSTVIIGTGVKEMVSLSKEAENFLEYAPVNVKVLPNKDAISAFRNATGRKALFIHFD